MHRHNQCPVSDRLPVIGIAVERSAVEPALSALLRSSDAESLLDIAFSEATAPHDGADETTTRLLDAAYARFCQLGIRRSTMEDVARQAGVSRITVYRRFASKNTLLEHVVRREFRRYFARFSTEVRQAATVADRVELGFVSSIQAIRSNPLIGGLLVAEPDAVLPAMTNDGGHTLATVQRFVADRLRRERHAGNVGTDVDIELVAEMMVRTAASFLVVPSHVIDVEDVDALRNVARRFLVPMLQEQ